LAALVGIDPRVTCQPVAPKYDSDNRLPHSAGGRECRAIDRNIPERQGAGSALLQTESPPSAFGTIGARVVTTRAPLLDGRSERAVIRTVPRITLRGLQRSSRARWPTPRLHRCRIGQSNAAPFVRTDIGQRPRGMPRVVPNVQPLQLVPGGIMRGRNRSRSRGPMRGREAFRRGRRVLSEFDARVDESLRAVARSLARQAARDVFNRAMSSEADRSTEEGRE
jgi:hypothetical protein